MFWGGREGYQCLWNTDMKREVEHLAAFMHLAVDYAKKIGFPGQFYFEPKPKEPTKHQYDFDCAACINFLRAYGLADHVKMNIETNHATLAGHRSSTSSTTPARRASWARSTPIRATCCWAGTPTSSPPTST